MADRCDLCKRGIGEDELTEMAGLDAESQGLPHGVTICGRCLERRRTRVWNATDPDHDRLVEALRRRDEPKSGRYAYLQGEEDVHLVRLRDSWLEKTVER